MIGGAISMHRGGHSVGHRGAPYGAYGLSTGITFIGDDRREQGAKRQLDLAIAGQPLSDYRQAEDSSLFWATPTSEIEAYVTAAYWLAVASRLTRSAFLARDAAALFGKRTWAFGLFSTQAGIVAILKDAAKKATRAGSQATSVAALLTRMADPAAVYGARSQEEQGSWIPELALRAGDTGPGAALRLYTSMLTGEKPPEEPSWKWNLKRAGLGIAVVGVAGLVVWLYTGGPARVMARRARRRVA